ncbi:MAG: 3'-phosphoesterase [Candidatus Eremiobacteraeota bacterium]|nr:3'-phosphoesterase [Candidatus Eremiobacteraeota bacterium]MBC5826406.1 3'-phosphoesterase [Candidatus Eremiobacteraeota bacterium]
MATSKTSKKPAPLSQYEAKRDFARTPEPRANVRKGTGRAVRFVVQKHRATRLHYDFRLEADGVLKSWAVPKGPSLDPADKRLAMQVEDHPLDYRDFEGIIPEDNYGAGEVIVWDKGTYRLAEGVDAAVEIAAGKIKFILTGKKLTGMFTLVKMRGRNQTENAWLLIKDKDSGVDLSWRAEDHAESVKSGRTLEDVAKNPRARKWSSNRPASGESKER